MLEGKVALVTGSTSGIGLATARALAAEGASLMLNGLGEADVIEGTRSGIADEYGVAVRYNPADMTRPQEIAAMIAACEAELGAVDILFNNAGIQHVAPVEDFPADQWDRIVAINLSAVFHGCRAALPGMKARGWGRIVNSGSAHALVASPHKSAYTAAKHGVAGLTKVVALETAETGVTCNAICPGFVRTAIVERQIEALAQQRNLEIEAAARELIAGKQPSGAFVAPEQVAALIVFLCSDSARQITGAVLSMDGGWTAQ
jgi:3-hydroxybutyrate dehydrogenase